MALVSLFFQTRAKLDQLDLDASMSESHEATSKLTQTEVEDGADITDHMTLDPIKLTIEGVISKTPLGSSALVNSVSTAAGGAVGKALGGSSKLLGAASVVAGGSLGGLISNAVGLDAGVNGKSRSPQDVYDYLLELRNRRKPFQVVTALKIYDSMVVTSISVPRSSATKEIIRFTATFEQIRVVKARNADAGTFSPLGGQAAEAAKLGKQSATEAAKKTSDNSSLLFKIFKGGGLGS